MDPHSSANRRELDDHLAGLDERIGAVPPLGWVRAVRDALGMSRYDLAYRMGVSPTRVCTLERGEVSGSVQLRTLRRAAAALDCQLIYVLVPNESLEHTVRLQAERKALELHADAWRELHLTERPHLAQAMGNQLDALAHDLVDRRGLWAREDGNER